MKSLKKKTVKFRKEIKTGGNTRTAYTIRTE